MNKLYIFEGIPGSGKTTTASWLTEFLTDNGQNAHLFLEGNPDHLADFESVACLTKSQLNELEKEYPIIRKIAIEKQNWFFISYTPFKENNPSLHKILQNYDVYELPVETFCEVALMRWQEFSERVESENKVYILECCFLQNPFTFLLAKHNVSKELIFNHVNKIAKIIAKINPVIFYFEQDNIRESINRVRSERSVEWFEFLTWYYTEQGYGKSHGLKGEKGVIHFLEERKILEKELLGQLKIKSLILNNSEFNWEKCKDLIQSDLQLFV
jgi:hypothetical protein